MESTRESWCILLCLVGLTLLSACSTPRPLEATATWPSDRPAVVVARLLDAKARECWERDMSPLSDGIRVVSQRKARDEFTVAAYRSTWGIGLIWDPFLVAKVAAMPYGAEVTVAEADFSCGFLRCHSLGLASHIGRWLEGKRDCTPFSDLLHVL